MVDAVYVRGVHAAAGGLWCGVRHGVCARRGKAGV
jgi:hypothetical protein